MEKYNNAYGEPDRSRFRVFAVIGVLLFIIGAASLIFSIIELFYGKSSVYNYDETQGGLKIENPLWPSSGKGFWVGLVLMATGLVGILAFREGSRSSIIGFTALSVVSTILSFYMMITCIMPIQYQARYSNNARLSWETVELVFNSLLIAAGALGTIVGTIASVVGGAYAGCCSDQRNTYRYHMNANKSMPATPGSMRYPPGTPQMAVPYQQPTFRMPM
ncbi:unnamed protein product [Adineta ricciae]|uniref:Uncharacterized protein n=1 Tax=Adineta ricciae TaxID=249248 RepID=A0A814PX74_ADIRI|nr:unnamed protein product [Adineta ricciae]